MVEIKKNPRQKAETQMGGTGNLFTETANDYHLIAVPLQPNSSY
jgi:hypothetical protein